MTRPSIEVWPGILAWVAVWLALLSTPLPVSAHAVPGEMQRTIDDPNAAITYTGFVSYQDDGLLGGHGHASQQQGATAELAFTGSAITWLGARNVDLGTADVFVDDVKEATIDQHADSLTYRLPLFQRSWSTIGDHRIKIVSTSDRHTVIDAFIVDMKFASLPATAPRWSLKTDTTEVGLCVWNDQLFIERLRDSQKGWTWLPGPETVPLPGLASNQQLSWRFQDAKVAAGAGSEVTLRFTCDAPRLELLSIWRAQPGAGPVEYESVIQNNSGGDLTVANRDLVSADLELATNAAATLHRFCKLADVSNDERAPTPVISTPITPEMSVVAFTRNGINEHPADIPIQVVDVGSTHGLYLGYEWSFGRFEIGAVQNDPRRVSYRSLLWADNSTLLAAGRSLTVPAVYLGAYAGDLDNAGNQFKRWFWKYKMTATLRDNPGEPLLEYCVPGKEKALTKFFADYPLASWGGELAKVDVDWLPRSEGPGADWFSAEGAEWNPDPVKWPNGMIARQLAVQAGQKLSLYMPQSYEKCDLATDAGREKEKAALLKRFDAGWFDYYRSDFVVEGSLDYLKHEGFMQVLDALIAQRPNFRYEHCSAGGTLKDFSTLQRMTFMTTDDSATPDGHRKTMYSATYFINPVQLKADIGIQAGPGLDQDPAWVRYCLRTGFMGANMATNTGSFTPAMITETKAAWPLYKEKMRPILRGADVYHILPPCNELDWDGLQYDNTELGQGAVLLFRGSNQIPDTRIVKLKGLDRQASYELSFQDRTSQNVTLTGAQLMDDGIRVTGMTGSYASEIIWLNKARR